MTTRHLLDTLRAYLDAEPRIEHGPHGIDDAAPDCARLNAARAAASHTITLAAAEGDPDPAQARLIEAAELFLCAEGALRLCESEHLPRLERLSQELAAARANLEDRMRQSTVATDPNARTAPVLTA